MSNPWLVQKATPEDILAFLFSDQRFRATSAEATPGKRSIMVDVGGESYMVGAFSYTESNCVLEGMGGGPAPWRHSKIVPCPISYPIRNKCPVCGGQDHHLSVATHHPIFRFVEHSFEE